MSLVTYSGVEQDYGENFEKINANDGLHARFEKKLRNCERKAHLLNLIKELYKASKLTFSYHSIYSLPYDDLKRIEKWLALDEDEDND